jgi:hypothetical protein
MENRSNLPDARLAFFRCRAWDMADLLPTLEWEAKDFVIRKSCALASYFNLGTEPRTDPNERLENEAELVALATQLAKLYPTEQKDCELLLQELYRCARHRHRQQAQAEVRQTSKLLRFKQSY